MSKITTRLLEVVAALEEVLELDRYTPILLTWNEKAKLGEVVNSPEFQEIEQYGSVHEALYADEEGVVGESDKKLLGLRSIVDFINGEIEVVKLNCWARYFDMSPVEYVRENLPELLMVHRDLFCEEWDFRNQLPKGCTEETISNLLNLNWAEPNFIGGSICNHGLSRNIGSVSEYPSTYVRKWTKHQGVYAGHTRRGKTLAEKRKGIMSHRSRSKAVWV